MTDIETKMISEREAVIRERRAFEVGAHWYVGRIGSEQASLIVADANERYPLPKVKRPRVVADALGVEWKAEDGLLWFKLDNTWRLIGEYADHHGAISIRTDRVKLWADLLASPLEEVDAE